MPGLCSVYRISKPCGFSTVTMSRESAANSLIMQYVRFFPNLNLILSMRNQRSTTHRFSPWNIFRGNLTSGQTLPPSAFRFSLRENGRWCARQRSMHFTERSNAKTLRRSGNTLSIPLRHAKLLWRNRKPSLSATRFPPALKH